MIDIMVSFDTIIPMTSGIYKITRKATGKAYIGMSRNIEKRWGEHIKKSLSDKRHPIHCALRKYGKNEFDFQIIEECGIDELSMKEKHHIQLHGTLSPKGYNMSAGGQHGYADLSDESKERHRAATRKMHQDPEYIRKHLEAVKKRSASPEWIEKNSTAQKALWAKKDFRERFSMEKRDQMNKRFSNPEEKKRHADMLRKRNADPEFKKIHMAAMKKLHSNPEHKERMRRILGESRINQNKFNFIHQVHGERFCRQIDLRREFPNVKSSDLSAVCSGKRKSCYGWSISK